jgi:endonuclease/exonuclease/phosphatase family metal-dependent hydrolase
MKLLSRTFIFCVTVIVGWQLQAAGLKVCSFNIQFLGGSNVRDDAGLTDLLKEYDIVVVQELIAPPYSGRFPDGTDFKPNPRAARFFDGMKQHGFAYWLSEEDTGPGINNHLNSTSTEWWVAFYRDATVKPATNLPSGFLASDLTRNKDFDRVPYAFAFRSVGSDMDFVLVSVHLQPGVGKANKARRKHELSAIASWIEAHDQKEKDFIILGDMNIENAAELDSTTPASFTSLNADSKPTNTNVNGPKPYDHVMYRSAFTEGEIDMAGGLKIHSLIEAMRDRWQQISSSAKYPGGPPYSHNEFRKYFSDHHPISLTLIGPQSGDDD